MLSYPLFRIILYSIVRGGEPSAKSGLAKDWSKAYFQGVDHGAPYMNGETVVFGITKE